MKPLISLSMPILGRSGIICATTLNPASLAKWNDSHTALTVWPLKKDVCWVKAGGCVASCSLPVRVSSHILIHALHTDLETSAAVCKHGTQVGLQTIIRPRLDGYSNTLHVTLFRVPVVHSGRGGEMILVSSLQQ